MSILEDLPSRDAVTLGQTVFRETGRASSSADVSQLYITELPQRERDRVSQRSRDNRGHCRGYATHF
jgi:hypothetical protein